MPELNLWLVTRLHSNFCTICCSSDDNNVSSAWGEGRFFLFYFF